MSRSGFENANNSNSNFRNNIIMSEEKLNPSANSTTGMMNSKPSDNMITDVDHFGSVTVRPKNPDSFVNLDDVNLMTRSSAVRSTAVSDKPDSRNRGKKPINYAAKKTVAQGMMDIALLTSNANQLKNLFDYQSQTAAFPFILFMIILSLLLQVAVGVCLIFKGRFDTKGKDKAAASRVNNWIMSAVFMITVVNIFIAVFSTSIPTPLVNPAVNLPVNTQSPAANGA